MKNYWTKVKSIFQPPIPYTPLLENGDSSLFFGTYEGQRFGPFDTDCCWDFSATELAETRLQMLMKLGLIPQDTISWLQTNGYIDSDGDFYLSRRWEAILSGVQDGGNDPLNFWKLASKNGLIPNSMLPYDIAEAQKWITKPQFNNDYFNPSVITQAMRDMGQEFLKRFSIQAKNIWKSDSTTLMTYLKEGSLQISIPVPQDGTWNELLVNYPQGRTVLDHAVELYKYDSTQEYPYYIYDSYEPHLKQLSKDYYIGFITRVSIKPISVLQPVPLPQFSFWMQFWFNVVSFFQGRPLPFPNVPIGRS